MPDLMRVTSRRLIASLSTLIVTAGLAAAPPDVTAKSLDVTEKVRLRLVKMSGGTLHQRGTARGTLNGAVVARFNVRLTSVTGLVTVLPRGGGSLSLRIDGHARSIAVRARFTGTVRVVGGTGRWAGARGSGRFSGVVNRRTWASTATVRARLIR